LSDDDLFYAGLARFYGWTHDYIMNLPVIVALKYYKAISVITASERIDDLNISSYPHMEEKGRKKLFKQYEKAYTQGKVNESQIVKVEEMALKLSHGR
jgi:hypothetical protein